MPLVSDLLGFVRQTLEMRGSLPVSRTLNMIQKSCPLCSGVCILRASLGECEKKNHQIYQQQFLHTVKEDLE